MKPNLRRLKKEFGYRIAMQNSLQYIASAFNLDKMYNRHVRPKVPIVNEYGVLSGIKVSGRQTRLLDRFIPWATDGYIHDFKAPNIKALRTYTQEGDTVQVIGSGFGVSTTVAANEVGNSGKVIAYDANFERTQTSTRTFELNGISDRVEIHHAVIGEKFGDLSIGDANQIPVDSLPPCDLLEMDCEGAEALILPDLEIRPDVIIVELHHKYDGCPYDSTEEISQTIEDLGYQIEIRDGPWVSKLLVGKFEDKA